MYEEKKDIVCLGLTLVDVLTQGVESLPEHWEKTVLSQSTRMAVGGGAANSAITFARLDQNVKLVCRVGKDDFGGYVLQTMKKEGVDTSLIVEDDKLSTGTAIGIVHKNGKRCFIVARGSNTALSAGDIDQVGIENTAVLHINGYFQFPQMEQDMESICRRFKDKGALITFDTASWDPTERWYETIRPFARFIDYFFANDTQLYKITGFEDTSKAAEFLMADGVKTVVAKLGPKGCTVYNKDTAVHIDEYPAEIIDTTGAGDSFDAAYITGVLKGWEPYRCGLFSNIVAALNCTKLGATAGVPSLETALRLLEEIK